MKTLVIGLWLFFGGLFSLHAQAPGAADSLKQQASRMGQALVAGNYNAFIRYLDPKIIEMAGGTDKLKAVLKQNFDQFDQQGMKFNSVRLDSATGIIKTASQLQCTIRQHTEIKLPQGRVVATSTLIGISRDNGLHWRFLDTNNKTIDQVKAVLPNLSSAIVIPPQQAPVRYDN